MAEHLAGPFGIFFTYHELYAPYGVRKEPVDAYDVFVCEAALQTF